MSDGMVKLKSFNSSMFTSTDPERKPKTDTVFNIAVDKLHSFKNHPFKLYNGERFDDMVESIKANGVLVPIIVRPTDNSDYEILSGHNRVECAKVAGLETVPAVVKENLTGDEALLIVTETNLLQRSFADMSHSERAVTLSMHHEAIKKQGKRNDLIFQIENMFNDSNVSISEDSSQAVNKLKSIAVIGQNYGLSKDSVARYIRINKLTSTHKERLDRGDLSIRAAVELSYLQNNEQQIIDDILILGNYKLDTKKAELLRQLSEQKKLNYEAVEEVFIGKKVTKKSARIPLIKIKPKLVSKYFNPEQKQEEIESTIVAALEYYFTHLNTTNGVE